jgi:hypothetical protein
MSEHHYLDLTTFVATDFGFDYSIINFFYLIIVCGCIECLVNDLTVSFFHNKV